MSFNSNINLFFQKLLPLLLGLLLSNTTDAFSLTHLVNYPITKHTACYTADSTKNHTMLLEINSYEVDGIEEIDMGGNASTNFDSPSRLYGGIGKDPGPFAIPQNPSFKTKIYMLYGRIGAV